MRSSITWEDDATMKDWRPAIVRMVEIKQAIYEADTDGLWEYHLPKVAATEDEIAAVEARLGIRLDPQYREFLRYANGWPSFYQSVDLFGTEDLAGGPMMDHVNEMLDVIEPEPVLEQAGLRAAIRRDLKPGPAPGP
jgi:hypothetical protein